MVTVDEVQLQLMNRSELLMLADFLGLPYTSDAGIDALRTLIQRHAV